MDFPTRLSRTPGTSLHRQVFLVLRDSISQGVHPPGEALPTEEALMNAFDVGRVTIRRALLDLELQGFVHRRHGRGTFVLPQRFGGPPAATLSYIDELKEASANTQAEVLSLETVVPPPSVAALLQIAPGVPALHIVRLRSAGTTPLILTDAWLPESVGRTITAAALRKRPLFQLLIDQDIKFGRVVQQISAEAADPTKAALLKVEVSQALIKLNRLLHDSDGKPIQYLSSHLSPHRSAILMDIPSEAIDSLGAGHIAHYPSALAQAPARPTRSRKREKSVADGRP